MSAPGARPGLVDWGLAERVGRLVAGEASDPNRVGQQEIDAASEDSVDLIRSYTGLDPGGAVPAPEAVDRPEWIRANLSSIRAASSELEGRLAGSLDGPGPLGPAARTAVGIAAGAEAGVAIGYLGRRVLGQYDIALIGPARPARLLFVAPNLAEAQRRIGFEDRETFLRWVSLHEATHAVQFEAVPWLREHIGGLVGQLLRGATLRPELGDLGAAARRLLSPAGLRGALAAISEQGVVGLLAGPRELGLIRRLQSTMTVIEGYSEHVMDAVGERLDPSYARLRELADAQRRRQSRLDAIVARLLGLDMKLRQYRVGKRFADTVADRVGIEGLNAVWRDPGALPDAEELERAERWMRRVGVVPRTAAHV